MASKDYVYGYRGGGKGKKSGGSTIIWFFVALIIVGSIASVVFWPGGGGDNTAAEAEVGALEPETPTVDPVSKSREPVSAPKSKAVKPKTPAVPDQSLQAAESALSRQEFVRAKELGLKTLAKLPEWRPAWIKCAKIISRANTAIINSDIPAPQKELYTIQAGDSLAKIAKKFNTTIEAVQKQNNLEPENKTIYKGNTFSVYKGDWSVRVKKEGHLLALYDNGDLFKIYDIGVGRQNRTPLGTFDIVAKIKEPAWEYRGKRYEFGTPENVLGTRWLKLKPTGTTDKGLSGYGIHGTWDESSIGRDSSNGCIRMLNKDVEELFTIVPHKTEVVIQN